jgi:hypothetical protein
MNSTRTLAIVAVLTAATLVVGLTVAATMTTSAFAGGSYKKDGQDKYTKGGQDSYKKDGQDKYNQGTRDNRNDGGSDNQNGNTVTVEKCKNKGSASGWDTTTNQECENLICTHPGSDGTCVSESEGAVIISNETNAALCPGGGFFNPSAGKCVGAGAGGT